MRRLNLCSGAALWALLLWPVLGAAQPGWSLIIDNCPEAILAGDFVSPTILYLGYDVAWEDALHDLMRALAGTAVEVLAPAHQRAAASAWVRGLALDAVRLSDKQVDGPWVRDYGPLQARDTVGRWRWLQPDYHATRPHDAAWSGAVAARRQMRLQRWGGALEGGGVVSNGNGLCAMTVASWRGLGLADGTSFVHALGCRVMVIGPALPGERTGHVDVFIQFTAPATVMVAALDEASVWNAALLDGARAMGQPLRVVQIPTLVHADGTPYSPVNGVRVGQRFVVPTHKAVPRALQDAALQAMGRAMAGVQLMPVPADALWAAGGGWHCATWGMLLDGG